MTDDPVRIDDGAVTRVTINRPDRLNALDLPTMAAFGDALEEARRAEARVLVITGAGDRAFVAGADISYMQGLSTPEALEYARTGHRILRQVEEFPAPVIAQINGYAFGGGLELALACDLRVASEQAVLGQTEIDLGIFPGWGGSQRLPRIVGDELARRLVYFGERVDATDALELGLVGDVVAHDELQAVVDEYAADLAAKPRHAMAAVKAAINRSRAGDLEAGLAFERRAWSGLFGTADQREGMAAFLEDREPSFE
ncbi:MAG: enoyl-CoA hydratase-related protein [Halobacteriales archaeon]|nr:enoyl-CoA hydratase-related protein [Halobacteriales archaeon]